MSERGLKIKRIEARNGHCGKDGDVCDMIEDEGGVTGRPDGGRTGWLMLMGKVKMLKPKSG